MNAWQRSIEFASVALKLALKRKRLLLLPFGSALFSYGLSLIFIQRTVLSYNLGGGSADFLAFISPTDKVREFWPDSPAFRQGVALGLALAMPFITLLFNTALIHAALDALNGGKASLKEAWSKAWAKAPEIALWAAASSGLWWMSDKLPEGADWGGGLHAGMLAGWGANLAWNLAFYFVIPILIFEGTELKVCLKRSFQLLAGTWKEQLIFRLVFMIALILFLFGLALLLSQLPFIQSLPEPGRASREWSGAAACLTWLGLAGAFESLFCAVLYSYAITGISPAEFQAYPAPEAP